MIFDIIFNIFIFFFIIKIAIFIVDKKTKITIIQKN